MAYTTVEAVKEILNITVPNYDGEISNLIGEAEGEIDEILRPYTSTPLGEAVPNLISRAATRLAAAKYLDKTAPGKGSETLRRDAYHMIQLYIQAHYRRGSLQRTKISKKHKNN